MTKPTLKVLAAFLAAGRQELAGVTIAKDTKLASGTLYPILIRLENESWLTSRWEEVDAKEVGRPRMRFYKLTGEGAKNAEAEIRELREMGAFTGVPQCSS